MRKTLILLLFIFPIVAFAQRDGSVEKPYEMFEVLNQATFQGGDTALRNFMASNISYPKEALDSNIQGVVVLRFVVDTLGEVQKVDVLTPTLGYGLEEEATRVLLLTSGKWTPASQRDKKVAVKLQIPISFYLK